MTDAFGYELNIGDKVLYGAGRGEYWIGHVTRCGGRTHQGAQFDTIIVAVTQHSDGALKGSNLRTVYASSVVKIGEDD